MDTTMSFFSLPFLDSETSDIYNSNNRTQEFVYDDIHSLPSHSGLLTTDDVLAQFLDDPLEEPDLNGPTTLHCEICRKQFDNAKKYHGHLRVHCKDNVWICDKCPDQKFPSKQHLMKHSLSHKPLQRVWRCQQCSMVFEALWRLQQHLFAKHLVYRPHKCDQCEKAFQKLSDLKKHKDMHRDVKRHSCSVCEMKFSDKSNLRRHMLTHTNEKPYCCAGCGRKFKQLASMKRHAQNCAKNKNKNIDSTTRKNHCKVCGQVFTYKSALLEHCVRRHSNTNPETNKINEDKTVQLNTDANGTVDKIVDDILLAEEDYMTVSSQNEMLNVYNNQNHQQIDNSTDNLMQIELLKDMNQLHALDDELLYNDLDFDNFPTSHIFNSNDEGNTSVERNEVLFDFTEGNKSLDQDIMNALYQVRAEHLPDELLNVSEVNTLAEQPNDFNNPAVSVSECATIFESDIDLEASTNLAANLNQLIGENSVQYIATEDDDTFIISLNSGIDAEQLTDMLNIGVELVENKDKSPEQVLLPNAAEPVSNVIEPIVLKIEESAPKTVADETKIKSVNKNMKNVKKQVLFVCRACNKVFNKKDNYISHMGTHSVAMRRHVCGECGARYGYRSSLNKHRLANHAPPRRNHRCGQCRNQYATAWMLRQHVERDHELVRAHACGARGCGRRFYKRNDLDRHTRTHRGERPFACARCPRRFLHGPHLTRHVRTVHRRVAH